MPTEMELTLEQTQQGVSYEVSVLSDIEDSHGPSDAMHNPLPATQSQKDFVSKLTEIHSFLLTFSLRMVMEVPDSSWLTRSIATCSYPYRQTYRHRESAQDMFQDLSATLIPTHLSGSLKCKVIRISRYDANIKAFRTCLTYDKTEARLALTSLDAGPGFDDVYQLRVEVNAASENMLEVTTASKDQVNAGNNMDQDSAHMVAASKVPMLKPENGATLPKTKIVEGVTIELPITSAEDKARRRLAVKARKVKGMSSSSLCTQNMAFVSSSNNNTSSSSEAVNAAHRVTTTSTQVEEGPNYALMAYSSSSSDSEVSSDSNCSRSCYKTVLESVEEKLEFYKKNKSVYVEKINGLKWDIQVGEITIGELRKKIEKIVDNCNKGLGYNAVPPPYIGNFMPPTPDLSFTGLDEFVNKPVVENCKAMPSEEECKVVRKNDDAPIIEE
ncbi:hypothetical protein Tco_0356706 [Tanacetum coccineum]